MSQAHVQSTLSPKRQPFLYLTAALVAGILIDRWIEPSRLIVIALALISVVASIKLLVSKREAASTIAVVLSFVAAGVLVSLTERTQDRASRLGSLYESKVIGPDGPG